jgi:ribosomal protein L37AE/L43A
MDAIHEENRRIVALGKCPDCGSRLRRNNALTGWWQCGRFGLDRFREPEYRGQPDCTFQCFTE